MMKKQITAVLRVSLIFFLFASLLHSRSMDKPVRIGVASMITPVNAVKYYQEIIDYVSEKADVPVEMIHRRTYDEMDKMLENGEVEAAFICSGPYIKNRKFPKA